MKNDIVKTNSVTDFDKIRKDIDTVKNIVAKGATDEELNYFAQFCAASGLNPILNQVHFIKRKDKPTFQTGIDGLRLIAERSRKYEGQTRVEFGPMEKKTLYYRGSNNEKIAVEKEVPISATIGIYKTNFREALYVTVYWDEFCPAYPNQAMWIKMPRNQLEKVAEAKGLRKAFPNDLKNVYIYEEMEQADGSDVEIVGGVTNKISTNPRIDSEGSGKADIVEAVVKAYKDGIMKAQDLHKISEVIKKLDKGLKSNIIRQEQYDELFKLAQTRQVELSAS